MYLCRTAPFSDALRIWRAPGDDRVGQELTRPLLLAASAQPRVLVRRAAVVRATVTSSGTPTSNTDGRENTGGRALAAERRGGDVSRRAGCCSAWGIGEAWGVDQRRVLASARGAPRT